VLRKHSWGHYVVVALIVLGVATFVGGYVCSYF